MGSYISVGFVFRNNKLNLKEKMFKYLIDSFKLSDYSVLVYKTQTDSEGKNYIEKKILYRNVSDEDYQLMTHYDYGNVLLMCPFLGISNQMMNIIYYKEINHFGFLIELFEDPFRKNISYNKKEDDLIKFIKQCFEMIPFDYVICENEGIIEFSPDEIEDEEFSYSFLILPKENDFEVRKGEYLLDGKTKR